MVAAVSVLRNIEWLVVVQEANNVVTRRGVDDSGRYDLVHRFMVRWPGRIMNETSAAAIHI